MNETLPQRTPLDLREHHFVTLRDEIRDTRKRIYRTMMAGVFGAPLLAYLALSDEPHVLLLVLSPFLVITVLLIYLAEQASMMRIGRYIRQHVEDDERDWERWLNSTHAHSAEPQLFATFMIIGLTFYFILTVLAVMHVTQVDPGRPDAVLTMFRYDFWRFGVPLMYVVATFWVLLTLFRFWRRAVTTSD